MIIANLQVSNTSGKYDKPSRVTVSSLDGQRLACVEMAPRNPLGWIRRNPDSPEAGALVRQLHQSGVDDDTVDAIMSAPPSEARATLAAQATRTVKQARAMLAGDPLYRAWFGLTVTG